MAKDFFHLAKFVLTFFDYFFVCIISKRAVFCINLGKNFIIKLEFDNTAFVINRTGCSIFNSLSHIINVNVVTEYFDSAAVFAGNWSSCKTDITCVWKTVADYAGCSDCAVSNKVALFVTAGFDFLCKSILSAVSFICHYDDILSVT